MTKKCDGQIDPDGNLCLSYKIKIAGIIISVLWMLFVGLITFIGKKALADIQINSARATIVENRVSGLEGDVKVINAKLDYIIKLIDRVIIKIN